MVISSEAQVCIWDVKLHRHMDRYMQQIWMYKLESSLHQVSRDPGRQMLLIKMIYFINFNNILMKCLPPINAITAYGVHDATNKKQTVIAAFAIRNSTEEAP